MNKHLHGSNKQVNKDTRQVNKDNVDAKNPYKFYRHINENYKSENELQRGLCFNSILDVMVNPVACKDKNGFYLFVNSAFEKLVGLPAKEIIGYTRLEICKKIYEHPHEKIDIEKCFSAGYFQQTFDEWNHINMEILRSGGTRTFEQEIACADGIKKVFLVNLSALGDRGGGIQSLVIVLQDITEPRKSEKALEKSEERYRLVTEQTGQLVYDFSLTTDEGSWAGAIETVTGYSKAELQSMGRDFWAESIHPADRDRVVKEFIKTRKTGESYRVDFRVRKKDGTYIYIENNGIYLTDGSGRPVRSLGAMKDITERKLAEEKIQESEDKYRSFVQNFKGIAFQFDGDFKLEFMHGAVEEITGYSEEELVSSKLWTELIEPGDLCLFKEENRIKQFPDYCQGEFDYRIRCKDGRIKWVREACQKVPGKDGKPDVYNGIIYDITEKKEAQEALAKVEIAKRKEVHHRIKNNLQVISSLLDLQAENVEDGRIKEVLRESQNRIISIALIHKELYMDREMNNVNFSTYLRALVKNLLNTYKIGDSEINLYIDLEENVLFEVETAVPLGIIINEVFSNSLKHAFPDRESGEIRINLTKSLIIEGSGKSGKDHRNGGKKQGMEKNARFTLTISDNGVGIPETFDLDKSDSLGLQLINVLIEQLDGKVRLNRNNGTEFIIEFAAENCNV